MRLAISAQLCIVALGLAACQTTGSSGGGSFANALGGQSGLFGKSYTIFYAQEDHVEELLGLGEVEKASEVWNSQESYFTGKPAGDAGKATEALKVAVLAKVQPVLENAQAGIDALTWPAPPTDWPAVRARLDAARDAIAATEKHRVLTAFVHKPEPLTRLMASLTAQDSRIGDDAAARFAEFPLLETDFAAAYPVKMAIRPLLASDRPRWESELKGKPVSEIVAFRDRYRGAFDTEGEAALGALHYEASYREAGGAGLPAVLTAMDRTRQAGLPLGRRADGAVRVVDVSSTPVGAEFPVTLQADLPFPVEKGDIDGALSGLATGSADLVVLVDVKRAINDRKISHHEKISSEYQNGTSTSPNPDYPMAQAVVTQAQFNLANVRQQANINAARCYGMGCVFVGVANGIAIGAANNDLQQAFQRMGATPMTLTVPTYAPYQFNRSTIDATKQVTVDGYLLDRATKTYRRASLEAQEAKGFRVVYGIHDQDRARSSHLASTQREAEVTQFERDEVKVSLAKLLARLTEPDAVTRPLAQSAELRREVAAARAQMAATARARTVEAATAPDGRLASVVVVRAANSLGSGFFVADDLVLTNHHVVGENQYIELKLHDGSDTFGKVAAHDARLDLALVKVQARGRPAAIHDDRPIEMGRAVEAIGHPKGLTFSLTRGVVSAVRDIDGIGAPGGRKVRVIQTDAAISPGNSGGPLFLGSTVIGVNTVKLISRGVDGVGFAVHHSEVVDFLRRSGVSPVGG